MSGSIPGELIEEIKERLNITDVVSEYVSLKKVGANHKGLCPFHSEKTPSFTVNEGKQIFYCFGCGAGGNVVTFLMKAGGMAFPEAVRELAKRAGVAVPEISGKLVQQKNDRQEALYKINESAAEFYRSLLSESEKAKSYLKKRGLAADTINDYKVGYGGEGWDSLCGFLSKKGLSIKLAEELGLIIPKKSGGYYDRFRGRVMFPISDVQGQIIGFGGRSIDGSEPKYLNSPESVLFKKSDSLYGINVARRWIREADEALVVEGYMDLLSLHEAGIKNSVATLGTALTAGHLRVLKRLTSNVVTLFDADQAGVKATLRALDLFISEEMSSKVMTMPAGHDPDTFVRDRGAEGFKKEIRAAKPIMEFFINEALKGRSSTDIQEKLKVIEEVFPYIERLPSRIEQEHYIKIVSERTGIKEDSLSKEMRKRPGGGPKKVDVKLQYSGIPPGTLTAEKKIIQLLLKYPELREKVVENETLGDFQSEDLRLFGESLLKMPTGSDPLNYFESEEERGLYSRLIVEMHEVVEHEKEFYDCIRSLKAYRLKREKEKLRKDMEEAVKSGDENLLWMELRNRHEKLK